MQCSTCGTQLPVGAAYCPTCGAVTPYNVSNSGISPHAPTAISSPSGLPEYKPATDYGSPPYGVPPQNPYEPLNPYDVPLQAPPPPSPKRHFKMGLIIGAVVLVVVLASVSVLAFFTQLTKIKPSGMTSPSPTSPAQISITATSTANSVPNPISPFLGMPVLNDPLRDNSKGNNWQEISDNSESCAFAGGAYHAKTLTGGYFYPYLHPWEDCRCRRWHL